MRPKREAFWNLLESSEPDIVLASETWLSYHLTTLLLPGKTDIGVRIEVLL